MCDIDSNSLLSLHGDFLTRGHRYKVMQELCINNSPLDFSCNMWPSLEQPPTIIVDFSFLLDSDGP